MSEKFALATLCLKNEAASGTQYHNQIALWLTEVLIYYGKCLAIISFTKLNLNFFQICKKGKQKQIAGTIYDLILVSL